MTRWRSKVAAFALIGGVIGSCSPAPEPAAPPVEMRRWGYASLDACRQDYPGESCSVSADFAALNECLLQKDLSVCEAEALASGTSFAWGPWHALEPLGVAPGDPGPGVTAIAGVSQLAATNETAMRSDAAAPEVTAP